MATTLPNGRTPVLADVARVAGVSVPTVSRVLTGSKRVSPQVEKRVRRAIEKLGYRLNGAARTLVSGRRSLVSVISGGTAGYGYAGTIEGIEQAARKASMDIGITVVESAEDKAVAAAIDRVLVQPVAGVVVLEFDRPGLAAIHAMPDHVPTVVAGGGSRRSGPRTYALIDERAGGREVTDYLRSPAGVTSPRSCAAATTSPSVCCARSSTQACGSPRTSRSRVSTTSRTSRCGRPR